MAADGGVDRDVAAKSQALLACCVVFATLGRASGQEDADTGSWELSNNGYGHAPFA